ncbi:GRRM system radical SAM/SPASM domain protein [Actinomadura fulvescens]|uniref:GRRM system radical SAM/SPASM domain protein n=1 Tax=Actinomadura fulvescens TaxID=46160 RepID=A0ABP6BRJ6_9ACTN
MLQNTSLCNLDCAYCYLPDRHTRRDMPPAVARAVAQSIGAQAGAWPVEVAWHAGEPLTMQPSGFRELLDEFEHLRQSGMVAHRVQTNATTIDPYWCDLLNAYDVTVGVSVDGPAWANENRRDRSGRPTHERTMHGIATLREAGVRVSAICVVCPENAGSPGELVDFFDGLGLRWVNFNLEEREAANLNRTGLSMAAAIDFWRGVIRKKLAGSGLRVRQLESLLGYLAAARFGRKRPWAAAQREPVPSVSWKGDVVLLSPELVDVAAPQYENFIVGNVLRQSLPQILAAAGRVRYVAEFVEGLNACREQCSFFAFCRGAQAGNRYFEHGTFAATETDHCRNTRQALVVALASEVGCSDWPDPLGHLERSRSEALEELMMSALNDLQRT